MGDVVYLSMKKLLLMRGIPGGGKSTIARETAREALLEGVKSVAICSTDDYHMVDGEYVFQPKMLGEFHTRNQIRASNLCREGIELVIIDNTNIKKKDMYVYKSNAKSYGYDVHEHIVGEEYLVPGEEMTKQLIDAYIKLCANRNTHGVPHEVVERMARTFEK